MTPSLLALIVFCVSLSALAQIVLKLGMSSSAVVRALQDEPAFGVVVAIATDWRVLGGLTLYFASAAAWLFVLARMQVSAAYPFVGLGFVLTMVLGWWLLGDSLSATRLVGTLLVAAGVVLIARS